MKPPPAQCRFAGAISHRALLRRRDDRRTIAVSFRRVQTGNYGGRPLSPSLLFIGFAIPCIRLFAVQDPFDPGHNFNGFNFDGWRALVRQTAGCPVLCLGTDEQGSRRCFIRKILYGLRISLVVGRLEWLWLVYRSISLGSDFAGYFGAPLDGLIMLASAGRGSWKIFPAIPRSVADQRRRQVAFGAIASGRMGRTMGCSGFCHRVMFWAICPRTCVAPYWWGKEQDYVSRRAS